MSSEGGEGLKKNIGAKRHEKQTETGWLYFNKKWGILKEGRDSKSSKERLRNCWNSGSDVSTHFGERKAFWRCGIGNWGNSFSLSAGFHVLPTPALD